jgi:uncharacterized protein (TIGR02145 family)
MKTLVKISVFFVLFISSALILTSCKKKPTIPVVTTTSVSGITQTTASSGGNVTGDGGSEVSSRGVCWSTNENPTTGNSKTSDGTGAGSFTSSLSLLTPGTKYYVRAYAINGEGTGYGTQVSFSTGEILVSTIVTTAATLITGTTATSGGNITADGGGAVTARGVCWATTANPTTSNNKTSDGSGTGSFTSSLTSLTPGTKYYVRAYAINSAGTAYGSEVSFTTEQIKLATLTTSLVTFVTASNAISGGNITADGGGAITKRGVCWDIYVNPTIDDPKTDNGTGTGNYVSNIINLLPGTKYYIRAYASNSAGTAYGNEVSFTTSIAPPICNTVPIQSLAETTAVSGGNISDDGGADITAFGICWSKNSNPTITDTHTVDGNGRNSYQSIISGFELTSGIVYYVRAYATNSAGTGYGNQVSFTTLGIIPKIFNQSLTYGSVTDIDGNIYKTIQIGTQTWMAENLETTKYNDGTQITLISDQQTWTEIYTSHAPAYCWFNDDIRSKDIYGALYSWNAVETGKLCPTGWHVPSRTEMTSMATFLGGVDLAGGKLKESGTGHWFTPNQGATNESGFTAISLYGRTDVTFSYAFGVYAQWWSSTYQDGTNVYAMSLTYSTGTLYFGGGFPYWYGFPVRCVKD